MLKICKILLIAIGVMNMAGCASLKIGTDEKAKGLENTRKLGVEINGELNGMFITSTDENNPVYSWYGRRRGQPHPQSSENAFPALAGSGGHPHL